MNSTIQATGYSPSSMKNLRKFYESWIMLDANSSVATDELENTTVMIADSDHSTFANVEMNSSKSTFANVELTNSCPIDIYHAIRISDVKDFPIEDFFRLPFSHHIKIIEGCKGLKERYYYIHRAVEENIPSDEQPKFIKKTADEMPEHLRKALPSQEEFAKLMKKED